MLERSYLFKLNKSQNGGIIMNNKLHFTKVWKFISNTIFNTTEYAPVNGRVHDNYDITDTTELRLISSRRTFL
jgi:hypothetical protein